MEIAGIDLNDLGVFERGFPHRSFDALRKESPVWWQPPSDLSLDGEGFWAVVDHAHTLEVVRDVETYSSESGGSRAGGGTLIEDLPRGVAVGALINMSDGATHRRLRGVISGAFTPRALARIEERIRTSTHAILDAVSGAGECDFATDVARELPLRVIADMLGVPAKDRHRLFDWAIATLRPAGTPAEVPARLEAQVSLRRYGEALIEEKKRIPDDSILSTVVHSKTPTATGERPSLSDVELAGFFSLLWSAGSETTRNALSGSLLALIDRPGEAEELRKSPDLWPTAIEELLRWVSPVTYNRRTVTKPAQLAGNALAPGDKVTFWYPSANRDASVFADPHALDLRRRPNPHLAFNLGEHVCLGAHLARREMRILLEEVLARWTDLEPTGPPRYARSNKHGGIESAPIRFRLR